MLRISFEYPSLINDTEDRPAVGALPGHGAAGRRRYGRGVPRPIAEALEAAHEKGIVHRDLKPANIKLTPEGRIKVLDFGLAQALDSEASRSDPGSPTLSGTDTGVIRGTPAYMSPEQARGERLDKRTDIWSFGCVLFEMLTGRRTYSGATASDSISAILTAEPDWTALPDTTPDSVRLLLRRCLNKERSRRLHDIADARIEIEDSRLSPEEVLAKSSPTSRTSRARARSTCGHSPDPAARFRSRPREAGTPSGPETAVSSSTATTAS